MSYDVPATPKPFPKADPITFLMVHGTWHSGSSWDGVRKHLEAAGHIVHSPTLGGYGKGAEPVQTLDGAIEPVLKYIADNDIKDFVVVGHSFGGVLATHLAVKVPGKVKRVIYHNAFICNDGESLWDLLPDIAQAMYDGLAAQSGNGTFPCLWPVFRDHFMSDAHIDDAKNVYDTLWPQSIGQWKEKLQIADFYSNFAVPKSVVLAKDDCTMPLGSYEQMANKVGIFRFTTLPGSHEVMFSDPEALARAIVIAGRE